MTLRGSRQSGARPGERPGVGPIGRRSGQLRVYGRKGRVGLHLIVLCVVHGCDRWRRILYFNGIGLYTFARRASRVYLERPMAPPHGNL